MDRELVLGGLLIITVGLTLFGAAPWPTRIHPTRNARWEVVLWRAVWWPVVPIVAVISVLIGWAIVEPAVSDEALPFSALVLSALFRWSGCAPQFETLAVSRKERVHSLAAI